MVRRSWLCLVALWAALSLVAPNALVLDLPAQRASGKPLPLHEAALDVARNVGTVGTLSDASNRGPVFVFEEFHTSRVGQLQIAVMLLRLHEKYGVHKIGLEGAMQSAGTLDATCVTRRFEPGD